jgi:tRNA pseudouridine55 synthase
MEGIVVINKTGGMTSHDIVDKVRKRFNMKRVGHAGTLDPLATGVLVVLLGRSTRLFEKFSGMDKAYRATLVLGRKTDSADILGKTISLRSFDDVHRDDVLRAFARYTGEIDQVPPMVSAVKFKGKKLYELARSGIVVEREARRVTVFELQLESYAPPEVKFLMKCSKGTYVRQLAEDIGEYLGCGACISQIQRTQVGPFTIEESVSLGELNENHIRRWEGQ